MKSIHESVSFLLAVLAGGAVEIGTGNHAIASGVCLGLISILLAIASVSRPHN